MVGHRILIRSEWLAAPVNTESKEGLRSSIQLTTLARIEDQ
ncbi:MAG: hypothetical protein WAM88_05390 [Nitrososphaeraceae archaeon]